MKMFKNKLKIILVILITTVLVGGISVYATYNYLASEVTYTKNGQQMSVEDALNQLYSNYKSETSMQLFCGNGYSQIVLTDSMYKNYKKIKVSSIYVMSGTCEIYFQDNTGSNTLTITQNNEYNLSELINNNYIKLTVYNQNGWCWPTINFYN